jgi:hypothetical protein
LNYIFKSGISYYQRCHFEVYAPFEIVFASSLRPWRLRVRKMAVSRKAAKNAKEEKWVVSCLGPVDRAPRMIYHLNLAPIGQSLSARLMEQL